MTRAEAGTTLVEMLIAMALLLVVTGAVLALISPAQDTALVQPAAMDMQQRARVGSDMLVRDLVLAGAGLDSGPAVGSLGRFMAAIVPRRMGLQRADSAGTARTDTLTIIYVPETPLQATLLAPLSPGALQLQVNPLAGCPVGRPVCGFTAGTAALVFDDLGHADTFTVTSVQGTVAQLVHRATDASFAYSAGAAVTEVATHTYYFDAISAQLRHYDGYQTDAPVIDNVVGLTISYFGDPRPPVAPKPPLGTANCLYDATGRAEPLPTLAAGVSLVPLPVTMFGDGPWCGAGSSQFDADLLRVRTVRVSLRVQAVSPAFRGVGPAFVRPGSSHGGYRMLSDGVFTFDVSPANLALR